MTYTLYATKGSGSFPVEAALVRADASFRIVPVDYDNREQRSESYRGINPMQQIPAMTLPDGTLMTESAAMVLHVAAAFPKSGLAPAAGTSAHARFLRWMVFMAINLYEADLRYFYPARFTTDEAGIAGVIAAGAAHMARSFALIEPELNPCLFGDTPSIGDVYLALMTIWSPVPLFGKFKTLREAVASDPVYGPVWNRNGLLA